MSAINAILALIDVIRSSTLVSAINIFAGLGDAILTQPKGWSDPDDPTGTKVSFTDSMANDIPASAVVKNRLQGSLKLAWASNTADANMLLPSAFLVSNAMSTGLGQFSPFIGIPRDPYSYVGSTVVNSTDYGRIDSVTAQTFEQTLESQYVPFYFHDIRTNEMISFHAFIAGITDDYAAAYNKSEGFGRVEPVKIYKNTERKISMSFYIAATSPNDFDDMWVKINKLVTLVYPQYTQGTQVSSADGTSYVFTQPFSQLVGASPLVRIRLGDLLRSNYTPFALGRLFGMGNTGFTIDSNPFLGGDALTTDDLNDLQTALQTAYAFPAGFTFLPAPGVYPTYVAPSGGGLSISLPSPFGGPSPPSNASQFIPDGAYFEITATDTVSGSPNLIYGTVGLRTDPAFVAWFTANQTALTAKYTSTDDLFNNVIGGTYVFPASSLIPTADTLSQLGANSSGLGSAISANSSLATSLATFLNPNDNAIAKSFQDTGGKGLAGFIETMHFDWYDKVTWETDLGRIAPKIVKVTIGFSPIHDISPGIDHMGFNRAPVYPVGIMGHDDVPVTPITSA